MKTGKGPIALSDEARDRVSEQLHARYVATVSYTHLTLPTKA